MSKNILIGKKTVVGFLFAILFLGCSDLEQKLKKMTSFEQDTTGLEMPMAFKSKAQELLNQNQGKAIVTGVLLKEGGTLAKQSATYTNAAGLSKVSKKNPLALSNADVMFYDALKPSTKSAYHTQSDDEGKYYAILDQGQYFAFAVKFDPATQELITARIDNIAAKKDSVVKLDSVAAAEDKITPTISSIYNATSPDKNSGIYLLTGVPDKKTKINVVFSEPMMRNSATGYVIGGIDTTAESGVFAITDTLGSNEVEVIWNGDNTVMTFAINKTLSLKVQYALYLPKTIKDLAKNSLEAVTKATFVPVKAEDLEAFRVAETFPAKDGLDIKPNQNPAIIFNRPVEIFSVLKNVKIAPEVRGNWEIRGNKAVFKQKTPFKPGKSFKISATKEVREIGGENLKEALEFSFKIAEFSGAAGAGGDKGEVGQIVEGILDAFLQGDIPRFASFLHPNFRMYEDGNLLSKDDLIEDIRHDVAERDQMNMGMPAPVYDNDTSVCKETVKRWLVHPAGKENPKLWVETELPPGMSRRVWDEKRNLIAAADIQWDHMRPRFTYKGENYFYDADFSLMQGPVTMNNAREDEFFFADMLKRTSNVVLRPVKSEMHDIFEVDEAIDFNEKKDTAKVAARELTIEKPDRLNFDPHRIEQMCKKGAVRADTNKMLLNFVLVKYNGRWSIVFLTGSDKYDAKGADIQEEFKKFDDFSNIKPLTLHSPVKYADHVAKEDTSMVFTFESLQQDEVGYIVGLAEDPWFIANRPPFGNLYFVKGDKSKKEIKFRLDKNGKPIKVDDKDKVVNASIILRDIHQLNLPGWERVMFEYPIVEMINHNQGYAGVYFWKVIAVKDTSASQFLKNGFQQSRFLAESDFRFNPEYGHFALKDFPDERKAEMIFMNQGPMGPMGPNNPDDPDGDCVPGPEDPDDANPNIPQPGGRCMYQPMSFGDMDMDGFPDDIERRFGTNPQDPGDLPDFTLDTDNDGMPDFLEDAIDIHELVKKFKAEKADITEPELKKKLMEAEADTSRKWLYEVAANAEELKKQKETIRQIMGLDLDQMDSDKDGFPDEIEMMMGFNPHDPHNRPGTRARVSLATGVYKGQIAFGQGSSERYKLTIKLIKNSLGYPPYLVNYNATIGKDTLSDTVAAVFEEGIGELKFSIRIIAGPSKGNSYVMRGNYDQGNALLMGPMDLVFPSLPEDRKRKEVNHMGGPYMGQWAVSSKINVEPYLNNVGPGPGPMGPGMVGPGTVGPGGPGPVMMNYRQPPPGVYPESKWVFAIHEKWGQTITYINDFGDTGQTFQQMYPAPQPGDEKYINGHIDLRQNPEGFHLEMGYKEDNPKKMSHMETHRFGEIFMAPVWIDEITVNDKGDTVKTPKEIKAWVFDGGFNNFQESCTQYGFKPDGSPDSSMCMQRQHRDTPGQFSAYVAADKIKVENGRITGVFTGWQQEDEHGTGFEPMPVNMQPGPYPGPDPGPYPGPDPGPYPGPDPGPYPGPAGPATTGDDMDGDCIPNWEDPSPNDFNMPVPGGRCVGDFHAPALGWNANQFMNWLMKDARPPVNVGGEIKIMVEGSGDILTAKNDSAHIMDGYEPECGFIRILPEMDSKKIAEKYNQLKLDSERHFWGMQLVLLESMPGQPGFKAKVRDKQGNIVENVFVVEERVIHGDKCGYMGPGPGAYPGPYPGPDPGPNPGPGPAPGPGFCDVLKMEQLDEIGPGVSFKPYTRGMEEFKEKAMTYACKPAAGFFFNEHFEVITADWMTAGTMGGNFNLDTDGKKVFVPSHFFHFPNQTGKWLIAASKKRDGDVAMVYGPNGPAILVIQAMPEDKLSADLKPLKEPRFIVEQFVDETFRTRAVHVHVLDSLGAIAETKAIHLNIDNYMYQGTGGEYNTTQFIILSDPAMRPFNSEKFRYVIMKAPMDPRPAVAMSNSGVYGLVIKPYQTKDLEVMGSTTGDFLDMDGDCINDMADPDPRDPNNPVPGGKCIGPGFEDMDGDCVGKQQDPDDNNFDIPFRGGNCVQDRDGDCVPDNKDPSPDDPNRPFPGGQCGYMDNDNDCVEDKVDPNPGNHDVPTPGGECNQIRDNDGDCVPDDQDPNPADPNTPEPGGACRAADNDGDCVPDDRDSEPNNPEMPTPGGECNTGDQDGDCVPDNNDPDPHNRDIPFMNGNCIMDSDGDCIPDNKDPEPHNPNMPVAGGDCGGSSTDDVDIYQGGPVEVRAALVKTGGMVLVMKEDNAPRQRIQVDREPITFAAPTGTWIGVNDPGFGRLIFLGIGPGHRQILWEEDLPVVVPENFLLDEDGDCVLVPSDPAPTDPNNPTPGGQCGTNPNPPPGPDPNGPDPMSFPIFNGDLQMVNAVLANSLQKFTVLKQGEPPKVTDSPGKAPFKSSTGEVLILTPDGTMQLVFLADQNNVNMPAVDPEKNTPLVREYGAAPPPGPVEPPGGNI